MTQDDLITRAKAYAKEQADALDHIYTDVSPEEWDFEYQCAYNYYMEKQGQI